LSEGSCPGDSGFALRRAQRLILRPAEPDSQHGDRNIDIPSHHPSVAAVFFDNSATGEERPCDEPSVEAVKAASATAESGFVIVDEQCFTLASAGSHAGSPHSLGRFFRRSFSPALH